MLYLESMVKETFLLSIKAWFPDHGIDLGFKVTSGKFVLSYCTLK